MGGFFPNRISDTDIILDPTNEKPSEKTQDDLRLEVEEFEDIMAIDYKYCIMVEGVSQESNLWVPRNQNETGLVDTDLQKFKNVAWNECVVRKFLTSEKGDVKFMGKSMINIIQTLNLQWKNLQVMGIHPKIEAAEKQVLMRCFEDRLIDFDLNVSKIARSLRRCNHFSDFFANAVGSYVCHNTGRTPGLSKTMYGSDIDFAYKEKNYLHFANALQKRKDIFLTCLKNTDHVDYIERLTRLKVIKKIEPNVDLADYDTGKCQQQPMYIPQSNGSYIDMGEILNFIGSKLDKIKIRPQDNEQISAQQDIIDEQIKTLTREMSAFTERNSFRAVIEAQYHMLNALQTMMEEITDRIQNYFSDPTRHPRPAPLTLPPMPSIVRDFIQRGDDPLRSASVANETVFTEAGADFTRNLRQRITNVVDTTHATAPIDQL
jgi:hypothetical protein